MIEYDGRDETTLEEAITLTRQFREGELDLLSVSIGFSTPDADIPWLWHRLLNVSAVR